MNRNDTDRLSEYLDGELSRDEAAAVEARLAEEPELRRLVEELRAVKLAAAAQPRLEAPPELWDRVRARIDAGEARSGMSGRLRDASARRRLMFTLPQLAAAAGIVLLLGVSLGRMTDQRPAPDAGPAALGPSVVAVDDAPVPGYAHFVADLEARLAAGRDVLEPGTARVIEESLAKIDSAIHQARTALDEDPNNVYLNHHLASAQSRKLRLLEDATALVASRT